MERERNGFFIDVLLSSNQVLTLKHQPHKLVKHIQIIRRLLPTNSLSVFDHFVGLALKGLIFIY